MKTLLNPHALADALTAFEDSLIPNEKPLAPDEDGGVNAAVFVGRKRFFVGNKRVFEGS